MPIHSNTPFVNDAFFQPLSGLAAASPHARVCPEFSDEHWLLAGVRRCLERVESGRAFLQEHGPGLPCQPSHANYFNSLHSERRLELVRDVNRSVLAAAQLPDRLAAMAELARYEVFAADGHWHKAATHDPRHKETKMPVGHFYSLDLRGHQLRVMATGEGLHEHDMSALKRIKPAGLRHGVPKGKRVLIVYDKAGIDFEFWKRCRVEKAVYFLSRAKEGLVYDWIEDRPLDPNDARNQGIESDRLIRLRGDGGLMRLIRYVEPDKGKTYEFLTNEMDLPACVLVELYRRRWEAEKVFDEIKNKLNEKKAWGTNLGSKETQAEFVALTHNLLLIYESRLEKEHGVANAAEDQRRDARQQELREYLEATGRGISSLVICARRATQRSVKLLRWLRHALHQRLTEEAAVPRLKLLYASL
jgi:hypothetical protein